MAEEDIYGNKKRYERLVQRLDELAEPPSSPGLRGRRRYFCRNPVNLEYFRRLSRVFEARDTSYVRRNRMLHVLLFACSTTQKALEECGREDVDAMVAESHQRNRTAASKESFLRGLQPLSRIEPSDV